MIDFGAPGCRSHKTDHCLTTVGGIAITIDIGIAIGIGFLWIVCIDSDTDIDPDAMNSES